jgi:hypothetical protein
MAADIILIMRALSRGAQVETQAMQRGCGGGSCGASAL